MSFSKKRDPLSQYNKVASDSGASFANPHRLVQMLMEGALEKIHTAKGQIERKDYEGKSEQITWAISIINGLRAGLDLAAGGEIAANLDDLYSYMTRRLTDASVSNDIGILDEVASLMLEIKAAWDAMPEAIRNAGLPEVPAEASGA